MRSTVTLLGWVALACYLLTVAVIVFWPVHVDAGEPSQVLQELLHTGYRSRFLPRWFGYAQVEWLSNVLMFVPGGLLFTLLLRPKRSWLVPLGGLGATLFIETIQHFMPGRTSSLLDVLSNSLGCATGWVLGLVVLRVVLKPTQTLKESA